MSYEMACQSEVKDSNSELSSKQEDEITDKVAQPIENLKKKSNTNINVVSQRAIPVHHFENIFKPCKVYQILMEDEEVNQC